MACEKDILCQIYRCKRTIPEEALYIDSSITPVKFILIGRRVMFYWTILSKTKSELVRQIVDAMHEFPEDSDWLSLVKHDLNFLNIQLSDEYLQTMTKFEMKSLVRKSIQIKKNEYLHNLQRSHSKTSKLIIGDKIQEYLVSNQLSTEMKRFLFSLRCRMSPNKTNFKGMYPDLTCRFCQIPGNEESLHHFVSCEFLQQKFPEIVQISPDDIYADLNRQIKATQVWMKVFKSLEETLNTQAHS